MSAVSWVAAELPLFAVNILLATPDDLWALRYPATHELYILERPAIDDHLEVRTRRISARSHDLTGSPSVVVASEPMDGETGWRLLDPGELVHVGRDLTVSSTFPLTASPAHPLTLADLSPTAAASQAGGAQRTQ